MTAKGYSGVNTAKTIFRIEGVTARGYLGEKV